MTKAEMAVFLADATGCSKALAGRTIEKLVEDMTGDLVAGIPVTIPGLCIIKPVVRAARAERAGRNPATGESLMVAATPERRSIKVKPSSKLKERMNSQA